MVGGPLTCQYHTVWYGQYDYNFFSFLGKNYSKFPINLKYISTQWLVILVLYGKNKSTINKLLNKISTTHK